jgi:hypothetical protein
MKNSKIILSCLISVMLVTSASAAWVPLPGTHPVLVSSLPDRTLIFGDKMLSEIDVVGTSRGGALAPDADSIYVQGGYDDVTGNYGLWFLPLWGAFSGQTVDATLNFKISILPGYDNYFITDVEMYITGASATGDGGVGIGEIVRTAPPPEGSEIAFLTCSVHESKVKLYDYGEFAPRKEIWIWSKDIFISGGEDGEAHLSGFLQLYSQVPEPATIVLLGTAGLWAFTRKKRSA